MDKIIVDWCLASHLFFGADSKCAGKLWVLRVERWVKLWNRKLWSRPSEFWIGEFEMSLQLKNRPGIGCGNFIYFYNLRIGNFLLLSVVCCSDSKCAWNPRQLHIQRWPKRRNSTTWSRARYLWTLGAHKWIEKFYRLIDGQRIRFADVKVTSSAPKCRLSTVEPPLDAHWSGLSSALWLDATVRKREQKSSISCASKMD